MKLLVVDDEKMIRQLIAKYAVFDGYEVAEAENGMQAVEMARAGSYDLIIMDIMMPELDGFGATRAIRDSGRPDARSLPILAMSANAFDSDVKAALESGMDGHIAKPFQVSELIAALARVRRRDGGEEV